MIDSQVGDLWLVSGMGGAWHHRLMRWCITLIKAGIHTEYSHVAMCIGEIGGIPRLISAESDGVRDISAGRYIDGDYKFIVRRNLTLTRTDRDKLYNTAIRKRWLKYSKLTLVAHIFGWRFANWVSKRVAHDKVCSELVGEIYYEAIGYRFCKRHSGRQLPPGGLRPRDIAWTTRLQPWADVHRRV